MESHLFDFIERYMPISEEEKQAIIDLDIIRSFEKGTVLIREGDPLQGGYFVLKGCLRSYYIIDGEERTTAFCTEAESLIPVAGSDESRSAHYVSCVEDSIITVGKPDMEKEVMAKFPRFEKLCLSVSEDLLKTNLASFADFKNANPEQRYLNLVESRPDLIQRVPQYQLASYLGITPQSLSRIRRRVAQKDDG